MHTLDCNHTRHKPEKIQAPWLNSARRNPRLSLVLARNTDNAGGDQLASARNEDKGKNQRSSGTEHSFVSALIARKDPCVIAWERCVKHIAF